MYNKQTLIAVSMLRFVFNMEGLRATHTNQDINVCVVPSASRDERPTTHPKTHRTTYILARGLMNAESMVGPRPFPVSSVVAAFTVQVSDCFLAEGGNKSSPLRHQIALSEPISFGEASRLQDTYKQHRCTARSPFTARLQGTLVADDVTTALAP